MSLETVEEGPEEDHLTEEDEEKLLDRLRDCVSSLRVMLRTGRS